MGESNPLSKGEITDAAPRFCTSFTFHHAGNMVILEFYYAGPPEPNMRYLIAKILVPKELLENMLKMMKQQGIIAEPPPA